MSLYIRSAPPDVVDELARQERCTEKVARYALEKAGNDPARAREWIRTVVGANEVVTPVLDLVAAQAAIAAADAELDSWGPHQDVPVEPDPVVVGSRWRARAAELEVIVIAIGPFITYGYPLHTGSMVASEWHDNFEPIQPTHTVELRIVGGPVLRTWNRREVIRAFDVFNLGCAAPLYWELVRVPGGQVIVAEALLPGAVYRWQSYSQLDDIIA